jgi:MraZ protein
MRDGSEGLYCCPTLDAQAVDAGGNRLREQIRSSLAQFEPFSPEYEDLATALIGESEVLNMDAEGRVVLTDSLKAHAGITDQVTFVGQGSKFQMWEPGRFAARREEARNRVREIRRQLGSRNRAAGAQIEKEG